MSTITPSPRSVTGSRRADLDEAGTLRLLTGQDRCDRCRAQAFIRATLRTDRVSQLFFCIHHGREHEAALRPQSRHWLDESRFLDDRPGPSSNA